MNEQQFVEKLKENGILVTNEQLKAFITYYHFLIEWNQKINLTAITKQEEVFEKHFYDSITPAFYLNFSHKQICDVGAGAGFPSIPLKILFPDLQLTIVDSLNKRIHFLNLLAEKLSISNYHFIHDRAENFGQNLKYREKFDIVIARAVAKLSVLSEYCLPLTKIGGTFIALKGNMLENEIKDAQNALEKLGGNHNAKKAAPRRPCGDDGAHACRLRQRGTERRQPGRLYHRHLRTEGTRLAQRRQTRR